jgi:DHA3 family macrolide efflux protein-like MFS transporter
MEVSRHVGFFIAPPVGSIMAAIIGPAALFLIDGSTFLLSGITVFFIQWRQPPRGVSASNGFWSAMQTVLQETAAGMGVIGRERLLQIAMLLGLALNVIVAPIQVLLPVFVTEVKGGNEAYFGLLVSGLLVGLIIGSLVAPAASRRLGLGPMSIAAVFILGAVISVAAWPPTLLPPLLAMTAAGASIGALNVAQTTMLQVASGDDELGRVSATYYTATMGVRPLSFLVMGAIASAVADIRFVFVGLGVLALVLGVVLARVPSVREAR